MSDTALVERKKYELEPCGIHVTKPLTFEDWSAMLAWLEAVEVGVQWWIGDAMIYGEQVFGEMYSQALSATGWQLKTIEQYRWVCSKVPFRNRRSDLSFFHHREVADLQEDQQAEWLARAAKGDDDQWSTDRLRQELNAAKHGEKARFFVVVEAKDPADANALVERMRNEGRKAKLQEKTPLKNKAIDVKATKARKAKAPKAAKPKASKPYDPKAPRLVKGAKKTAKKPTF